MKAESKQIQQGTAEWHQHRAMHFNASEAAAMLGLSSYKTRSELLREKATGITPDVDSATQARFDKGHEYEDTARMLADEIIGSELYPMVFSGEYEGLPLSASLDGITLLEDVTWEHKSLNKALAAALDEGRIPEEYWPQMEQGLMLTGAEKCLFMTSNGDRESMRYAWYESKPEVRAKLLSGWKQFAEDLANYQHVETPAEVVGATVEELPAIVYKLDGLALTSNLDGYRNAALRLVEASKTKLVTDQEFADQKKRNAKMKEAEEYIDVVKGQAIGEINDVDRFCRDLDEIKGLIRQARLAGEKQVKEEEDNRRAGLVMQANKDLAEYIKKMNASLGGEWMPVVDGGFATAIKGKKTMTGLRDAIDTAMADAKIRVNEIAIVINQNRRHLEITYANDSLIAPDFKAICTKAPEDFAALLAMRKRQHDEVIEQQRQVAEAEQRAKASSEDVKPVPNTRTEDAPGAVRREDEGTQVAKTSSPPDNGVRMKLGDINAKLGFTVSADFLARIGFAPVATEKNAKLYRQCDWGGICAAISEHVAAMAV